MGEQHNTMKKTFKFGKIDFYGNGRRINAVEVEIELRDNKDGKPVFSAMGSIWNSTHTDIVCCGQCLDLIAEYVKNNTFKAIHRLWELHHLNNLNAGTPRQMACIKEHKSEINESLGFYKKELDLLERYGLVYDTLEDGTKYKYGTAWLYREIPQKDLKEIMELFE